MEKSPKFRILVVDDCTDFVRDLTAFFAMRHEVSGVCDSEEVLKQVAVFKPNVVLLDDYMDGSYVGIDILGRVQAIIQGPKVIMMTTNYDPAHADYLIQSGAFQCVLKPPNLKELVNLVTEAASKGMGGV